MIYYYLNTLGGIACNVIQLVVLLLGWLFVFSSFHAYLIFISKHVYRIVCFVQLLLDIDYILPPIIYTTSRTTGPLLLICFNFDPSMIK